MKFRSILLICLSLTILSCNKDEKKESNEVWIYTSMYKDTIADMTPKLQKAFPNLKFQWFQAGSEEIATKVNAEILAGGTQADILISSDRFWYEEMGNTGYLIGFNSEKTSAIPSQLKHPKGYYNAVSIPVMVMAFNSEAINESDAPKSFKEMADDKWKAKFTTGSPLASGTNFTTMAMLQHNYGWDYFKALKNNETIAQGGNSSVLRRIQSKERPVGWVLLENLLRFQDKDQRLKTIFPEDGVVLQANVMGITKKDGSRENAKKVADWFLSQDGQAAMVRSFMYSPFESFEPPKGAPPFSKLLSNSFEWSKEFIEKTTKTRAELKEKFTEIMFQ
ncbi:MAG: extracellular solute-binding protein [Deltaproteobacteria bacterium]|nr:MAG: extracellular solute-binding protein [Deltaproteobacteria bacterium]TNF27449.1 MAG: extracellular solute-binding protein [Deltaproteobacteria bacterium]